MSDDTYNGWKNYPTWNVKLWIDNEQGSYEYMRDMARRWSKHNEGIGSSRVALFADELESVVTEWIDEQTQDSDGEPLAASMASDLLGYALGMVDWYEIAEAYLEDIEAD